MAKFLNVDDVGSFTLMQPGYKIYGIIYRDALEFEYIWTWNALHRTAIN